MLNAYVQGLTLPSTRHMILATLKKNFALLTTCSRLRINILKKGQKEPIIEYHTSQQWEYLRCQSFFNNRLQTRSCQPHARLSQLEYALNVHLHLIIIQDDTLVTGFHDFELREQRRCRVQSTGDIPQHLAPLRAVLGV